MATCQCPDHPDRPCDGPAEMSAQTADGDVYVCCYLCWLTSDN